MTLDQSGANSVRYVVKHILCYVVGNTQLTSGRDTLR